MSWPYSIFSNLHNGLITSTESLVGTALRHRLCVDVAKGVAGPVLERDGVDFGGEEHGASFRGENRHPYQVTMGWMLLWLVYCTIRLGGSNAPVFP